MTLEPFFFEFESFSKSLIRALTLSLRLLVVLTYFSSRSKQTYEYFASRCLLKEGRLSGEDAENSLKWLKHFYCCKFFASWTKPWHSLPCVTRVSSSWVGVSFEGKQFRWWLGVANHKTYIVAGVSLPHEVSFSEETPFDFIPFSLRTLEILIFWLDADLNYAISLKFRVLFLSSITPVGIFMFLF